MAFIPIPPVLEHVFPAPGCEIKEWRELCTSLGLRNAELSAEIERLKEENAKLRKALALAGKRCDDVHHPKSMQHAIDEPCPVVMLIADALAPKPAAGSGE